MNIPKWLKVLIILFLIVVVSIIGSSALSLWSIKRSHELLESRATSGPIKWGPIFTKGIVGTLETNFSAVTNKANFNFRLNKQPPPQSEFGVGIGTDQQLAAWVEINSDDFKADGDYWIANITTKELVSAVRYARSNKWALIISSDPRSEVKEGARLTD